MPFSEYNNGFLNTTMATSPDIHGDALCLILVGHCLEAKCDVANSLLKQRNYVKHFACRVHLVTKSRRTLQGLNLHVIVTPNFNTPAWKNSQQDIRTKFKRKVFVYLKVKDDSSIDSDDKYCINHLKETFLINAGSILTIIYDKVSIEFEREIGTIVLYEKSTFEVKCKQADRILQRVSETIHNSRSAPISPSSDKVDSKKRNIKKKLDTSISIVDQKRIESVTVAVDQVFEKQLPELTEEHWRLYRATLTTSKARSNHVRVNVMGIQEAGKTTLIQRLQCLNIDCPVSKMKPTEGLNIYHTTLRCFEVNGKREWEWKDGGYEEELNIQRMAFAMKQARDNLNKCQQYQGMEVNALQRTDHPSEINEQGSDSIVEGTVSVKDDAGHLELMRKKTYLKQVIQRLHTQANEYMYLSFWDFAGQTTYYTTHQAFMSPAAVYVLVVDLSMDLKDKPKPNIEFRSGVLHEYTVEETLHFLVASITAFTRDELDGHAPFIIVGTHRDKVTDKEAQMKVEELRKALNTHAECIFIDNTLQIDDDPNLITLRNRLLDLGLGVRDTEISAQWFDLERCIIDIKTKKCISSLKEIIECDNCSDIPMLDETRIKAFLEHQHINGSLLYFGHNELQEIIILDPAKFACLLNKLLTAEDSSKECNGIVDKKSITETIIKINFQCDQTTIGALIRVLQTLHIIHPLDLKNCTYFLPCLLPQRPDPGVKAEYRERAPTLRLRFQNTHIPPAFFHTLVSAMNGDDLKIFCDNSSGVSRVFNLYACFYFKKRTIWLEMIWEKSNVYFMLKNFSGTIRLEDEGCDKIIDLIEANVNRVLTIYRQENVKFVVDIQCHTCKQSYIAIQELRDNAEVMCVNNDCIHTITRENVGRIYLNSQPPIQREVRVRNVHRVSERDLGRLARHLTEETPLALARLLRLSECPVSANNAVQSWPYDENMQRLYILRIWKAQHCSNEKSVDHLLKILMKHNDYTIGQLARMIEDKVVCQTYDLEDSILDSGLSDIDICKACSHIGRGYPFLAIELGLSYVDVEHCMCNCTNHVFEIIRTLLGVWRSMSPETATIRTLLDTATFVGIYGTDEIVKDIKTNRNIQ